MVYLSTASQMRLDRTQKSSLMKATTITTQGTVVSTTPATDIGGRAVSGPLRARRRRAYAESSASPHRSGAGSMAAEGTSGGGSWKGHRDRQDEGGRQRRAARGRKTEVSAQRRSEAPGQRKGGYDAVEPGPDGGHGTREARKSCEWSDGEWDGWVRMWVRASARCAHVGAGAGAASRAWARGLASAMRDASRRRRRRQDRRRANGAG
jgi:hypothetical protein